MSSHCVEEQMSSELSNALVWQRLRESCELVLRLDDGEFDEAVNIADRSCLGTAVVCESQAINLVLVGMDRQAQEYFKNIRNFALLGFHANETYVYESPDGQNLFAKYMAMRIAALAEWVLGGSKRPEYLDQMLFFLEQSIEFENSQAPQEGIEEEVLARYAMHLAQVESLDSLLELPTHFSSRNNNRLWGTLIRSLVDLAGARVAGIPENILKTSSEFEDFFLRITDVEKIRQPYDQRLTANDIVTIAEIRSRWLYEKTDPMSIIRSIRNPADDCGV
jgi:hypothetical protein